MEKEKVSRLQSLSLKKISQISYIYKQQARRTINRSYKGKNIKVCRSGSQTFTFLGALISPVHNNHDYLYCAFYSYGILSIIVIGNGINERSLFHRGHSLAVRFVTRKVLLDLLLSLLHGEAKRT